MSITGIGLRAIPISIATACGKSIGSKRIHEIFMQKYNKCKEQNEKDQKTIKSFDKSHRNPLQHNINDKNEMESLCIVFTKHLGETKNESFS